MALPVEYEKLLTASKAPRPLKTEVDLRVIKWIALCKVAILQVEKARPMVVIRKKGEIRTKRDVTDTKKKSGQIQITHVFDDLNLYFNYLFLFSC